MAHGVHPTLKVADLDRSLRFYRGLGLDATLDEAPAGPGASLRWVTVRAGPHHAFRLFLAFPGFDPALATGTGVGDAVLLNVGVRHAGRAHARAEAAGARPTPLEPNPWGGHAFALADPDGHLLKLTDRFPAAPRARKAARKKTAKKTAGKMKKQARTSARKKTLK